MAVIYFLDFARFFVAATLTFGCGFSADADAACGGEVHKVAPMVGAATFTIGVERPETAAPAGAADVLFLQSDLKVLGQTPRRLVATIVDSRRGMERAVSETNTTRTRTAAITDSGMVTLWPYSTDIEPTSPQSPAEPNRSDVISIPLGREFPKQTQIFLPMSFMVLAVLAILVLLAVTMYFVTKSRIQSSRYGRSFDSTPAWDSTFDTSAPKVANGKRWPPPISELLILPATEANFMIPVAKLKDMSADGLDIVGTTGKKLLQVAISEKPDGIRRLQLALVNHEEAPLACVEVNTHTPKILKVIGRDNRPYGTIVPHAEANEHMLLCDGKPAILFRADVANGLQFKATVADGSDKVLATGCVIVSSRGGEKAAKENDKWRLQVKPGADGVLIISSILSIASLKGT